jgi:hypothetical protein
MCQLTKAPHIFLFSKQKLVLTCHLSFYWDDVSSFNKLGQTCHHMVWNAKGQIKTFD